MKNKHFISGFFLIFCFVFNTAFGQIVTTNDYADIPNGTANTIAVPNVLANDTVDGLPVTISNVILAQVSSTNNFLQLDETNGSVLFSGGPSPTGTYRLIYNATKPNGCCGANGYVYVSIGCDAVNPPIITNVLQPNCTTSRGSLRSTGFLLPVNGNFIPMALWLRSVAVQLLHSRM